MPSVKNIIRQLEEKAANAANATVRIDRANNNFDPQRSILASNNTVVGPVGRLAPIKGSYNLSLIFRTHQLENTDCTSVTHHRDSTELLKIHERNHDPLHPPYRSTC